ncbi:hypothetical protein AKJ39_03200 [candidate division MSBL1 archaeon SCGC-AAA259J03]|uniref:Uncharacterized protein n=1 Tax=candidate division MSBL1 archaeon SCGC-AAA259J03 TaxID=1698269 RepID=A0A656YWG6_9EURY|nr:hypothetical protein AKJ39_03200 [candidate division MSBL1 archaeon SCGC-AAA259J03]
MQKVPDDNQVPIDGALGEAEIDQAKLLEALLQLPGLPIAYLHLRGGFVASRASDAGSNPAGRITPLPSSIEVRIKIGFRFENNHFLCSKKIYPSPIRHKTKPRQLPVKNPYRGKLKRVEIEKIHEKVLTLHLTSPPSEVSGLSGEILIKLSQDEILSYFKD